MNCSGNGHIIGEVKGRRIGMTALAMLSGILKGTISGREGRTIGRFDGFVGGGGGVELKPTIGIGSGVRGGAVSL